MVHFITILKNLVILIPEVLFSSMDSKISKFVLHLDLFKIPKPKPQTEFKALGQAWKHSISCLSNPIIYCLFQLPAPPPPIQLAANVPGRQQVMSSSTRVPVTQEENPDGVPGFGLVPLLWAFGVNQRMNELSLILSLAPSFHLSSKYSF